jgi:hypothetical protein
LRCALAHEFEAWFASSESYEAQAASRQVRCPECGDLDIGKAIMAPNVAVRDRSGHQQPSLEVTNAREQIVAAMREVRRSLAAAAEDVGARFPEEARKIHYGETAARGIRGTASGDEVRTLLDEGISVIALPPLPEDTN